MIFKIRGTKGSALVTALITMTVLVLLGLAVITLSLGTLKLNQTDAINNDSYYAAEAGINSAIEQLKVETSQYYGLMLQSQSATYMSYFNNFFTNIKNNAQANFLEPKITGITTSTTFTNGTYDPVTSIGEFLISCTSTATADGTQYVVNGKLRVKRVDVRTTEEYDWISDGAAVKAGGTLDLSSKNSVTVNEGDILVGDLIYTSTNPPYSLNNGQLIIDQNVGLTIQDKLEYSTYTTPTVTSGQYYATSMTINIKPNKMPIYTAPGVDLHFANLTIKNGIDDSIPPGIIYVPSSATDPGNIMLNNVVCYADIYCDGDVTISNGSQIYGKIYCRGNVYATNSNFESGTIICDGIVDFTSGVNNADIFAQGGIGVHNSTSSGNMFSPAPITVDTSDVTDGIIYSKTKLTLGSSDTMNAIFFSGQDIEFTGDINIAGMVIAKEDIYFKVDANKDLIVNYYYSYSEGVLDSILHDPNNSFFFSAPGPSRLDTEVIKEQYVTPVGRS